MLLVRVGSIKLADIKKFWYEKLCIKTYEMWIFTDKVEKC